MTDNCGYFECAICQEEYTDPRLLRCSHTFCRQCLDKYVSRVSGGNTFECPLCREQHILPSSGAIGIQKNFYLAKKKTTNRPSCRFCKIHPEEDLRFYCRDCATTICRDCKVIQHNGHKTELVSDVAADMRHQLDSLLTETDAKVTRLEAQERFIMEKIERKTQISAETIEHIDKLAHTCKSEVDKLVQELQNEIHMHDEKKSFLRDKLTQIREDSEKLKIKKESVLITKDDDNYTTDSFKTLMKGKNETTSINSDLQNATYEVENHILAKNKVLSKFKRLTEKVVGEVKAFDVKSTLKHPYQPRICHRLAYTVNSKMWLKTFQVLLCVFQFVQALPIMEIMEISKRPLTPMQLASGLLYLVLGILMTTRICSRLAAGPYTCILLYIMTHLTTYGTYDRWAHLLLVGLCNGYIGVYLHDVFHKCPRWVSTLVYACLAVHLFASDALFIGNISTEHCICIFILLLITCLESYALPINVIFVIYVFVIVCIEIVACMVIFVNCDMFFDRYLGYGDKYRALTHLTFESLNLPMWLLYFRLRRRYNT